MNISPGLENIIQQIRMLGKAISNAQSSQEIQHIIFTLEMLGSGPEAMGSDIARHLVFNYVRLGYTVYGDLKFTEAKSDREVLAKPIEVFPISRLSEPLATSLKEQQLWSKDELARFESINPAKQYSIVLFSDDGEIMGEGAISGARLRNSATLLKAYAHKDELNEEGRRRLDEELYGPAGHGNDPERIIAGLEKIKRAAKDVSGDTAARATTQEEKEHIGKELKKTLDSIEKLQRLHRTRAAQSRNETGSSPDQATQATPAPSLPAGSAVKAGSMMRAADRVIAEADSEVELELEAMMFDWAKPDKPKAGSRQTAQRNSAAGTPQNSLVPPPTPASGGLTLH